MVQNVQNEIKYSSRNILIFRNSVILGYLYKSFYSVFGNWYFEVQLASLYIL